MSTVRETRESLQRLVNKLKEYPDDSGVRPLILIDNVYSEFDIAYWMIGDVTENSVDILF